MGQPRRAKGHKRDGKYKANREIEANGVNHHHNGVLRPPASGRLGVRRNDGSPVESYPFLKKRNSFPRTGRGAATADDANVTFAVQAVTRSREGADETAFRVRDRFRTCHVDHR